MPVLLQLLTKVDESDAEDDYNVAKASYQCLQLYAQCIGGEVVAPVLTFVEANLRNEDWHNRDAAVAAFGAIMDGPDIKVLDPLVKQALPVLISMMDDFKHPSQGLGGVCPKQNLRLLFGLDRPRYSPATSDVSSIQRLDE